MTEIETECWSCDFPLTVVIEAGEASVLNDETCENKCPACGSEQDMEIEYDVSAVHTSQPKHMVAGQEEKNHA